MKIQHFLLLAVLLPATAAFGQIVSTDIVGNSTGVSTNFSAWIDGQDLHILVDNAPASPPDPLVTGTVTAFGFNTPWDGGTTLFNNVQLTYALVQDPSDPTPDSPWTILSPTSVQAGLQGFTVDLAAQSDDKNDNAMGNDPKNGVAYGQIVDFKFTFTSSFDLSDYAGETDGIANILAFFDPGATGADSMFARWQDVEGSNLGTSDTGTGHFDDGGDTPVPEPSTYGLVGAAALRGLILLRKMRR